MGRRAVAAGVGLAVAVAWNIANVGAAARTLADEYDVGLAAVGVLTSALFVVHAAMQIPAGLVVDRIGARRAGIAAALVLVAANAVAVLAPWYALGLAARAFAGVGTGLGFVAGSDYIRATGGSAAAQGVFGAGVAGGGVALAVVPLLEHDLAWRAPFASATLLGLAAAILLAAAPREVRVVGASRGSLRTILGDRVLYRFSAVHAASFGLSVVVGNWVVTLLEEAGVRAAVAGILAGLTLFAGAVSRPLGGWLARTHPQRTRAALSLSLAAGALGTLVLALPAPLPVLGFACLVIGVAAGIPFAPAFAGTQRSRPDAPGAAIGFVNTWAALTIVVGTPLLGLAFALPGDGRIGFAVAGALWAASLLALPSRRALGAR